MVKVYSTPDCSWCKKSKEYLKSRGIEFLEVDVQNDLEGREEMVSLTGQMSIPVIRVKDDFVIGFDREKIDAYLAQL